MNRARYGLAIALLLVGGCEKQTVIGDAFQFLTGCVVDSVTAVPLAGVLVVFDPEDGDPYEIAVSDSAGKYGGMFYIGHSPPPPGAVSFELTGYQTKIVPVSEFPEREVNTVFLDIELAPDPGP